MPLPPASFPALYVYPLDGRDSKSRYFISKRIALEKKVTINVSKLDAKPMPKLLQVNEMGILTR